MTLEERAEFEATLLEPLAGASRAPDATMPTQAGVANDVDQMMLLMGMQ